MTDIMLRGALNALKTKIEALAASETASAEDLAMLGTALERIAGKTTAIEVEMVGEEQRAALTSDAAAARENALQAIASALSAADEALAHHVSTINAAGAAAITPITDAGGAALTAIQAERQEALTALAESTEDAVAEVSGTLLAAVTTASGLTATSFFLNQL
jgi:DNA anti-recombination protein RmuC